MISYQPTQFANLLYGTAWYNATVTTTSAFTLAGDQRSVFEAGQSIELLVGGTSTIAYVNTVAFASGRTTITTTSPSVTVGAATSVRPSPMGGSNYPLSRNFNEINVTGPNGLLITRNTQAKQTFLVPNATAVQAKAYLVVATTTGFNIQAAANATSAPVNAFTISAAANGTTASIQSVSLYSKLIFDQSYIAETGSTGDTIVTVGTTGFGLYFGLPRTGLTNRLSLVGPAGGSSAIGPLSDSEVFSSIRLRATRVLVENGAGGTSVAGDIWHSANFDPGTKVTVGSNNTWIAGLLGSTNDLSEVTTAWMRYNTSAASKPENQAGLIHTFGTRGDDFTLSSTNSIYQMAFSANGGIWTRNAFASTSFSAWRRVWTGGDFSPDDYVPMAGNVTVRDKLGVTGALLVRGDDSTNATMDFWSSNSASRDGRIMVTGGTSTTDSGAMTMRAASLAITAASGVSMSHALSVSGTTTVGGALTVSGVSRLNNSVYVGATSGENVIQFNLDGWYLYNNAGTLGAYHASSGMAYQFVKASRTFSVTNFAVAGSSALTTLNVSGTTVLTGTLTAQSGLVSNSVISTANLYVRGGYAAQGQGSYMSWNDGNGDGATYLTNDRGGGSGGFKFRNGNNTSMSILAYINPNGSIQSTSDARLKTFHQPIELGSAVEFIRSNRASYFTWKTTGDLDIGFPAQSVNETTKHLAEYDEANDLWTFSYSKIALYHHEALNHILKVQDSNASDIQVLILKNEELERRIAQLEQELDS